MAASRAGSSFKGASRFLISCFHSGMVNYGSAPVASFGCYFLAPIHLARGRSGSPQLFLGCCPLPLPYAVRITNVLDYACHLCWGFNCSCVRRIHDPTPISNNIVREPYLVTGHGTRHFFFSVRACASAYEFPALLLQSKHIGNIVLAHFCPIQHYNRETPSP